MRQVLVALAFLSMLTLAPSARSQGAHITTQIGGTCGGQPTNVAHFSFTSTNPQLIVPGLINRRVVICAIGINAPDTNVAMIEGVTASTPCDTGATGMAGGTTAATGWQLANANAVGLGITEGDGYHVRYLTAADGDSVCLVAGASNPVSGEMVWYYRTGPDTTASGLGMQAAPRSCLLATPVTCLLVHP
jgi:hypothetical protein